VIGCCKIGAAPNSTAGRSDKQGGFIAVLTDSQGGDAPGGILGPLSSQVALALQLWSRPSGCPRGNDPLFVLFQFENDPAVPVGLDAPSPPAPKAKDHVACSLLWGIGFQVAQFFSGHRIPNLQSQAVSIEPCSASSEKLAAVR